jgi:sugar lactone lactonase YvrE
MPRGTKKYALHMMGVGGLILGSWLYGGDFHVYIPDNTSKPSLAMLQGIAVAADKSMYCAMAYDVKHIKEDGTLISEWGGSLNWNDGNGTFANPSDIALDSQGNVYVADPVAKYIQKFDPNGNFLMQWGYYDGLNGAWSVAIDSDDNVFIKGGTTVQKFDTSGRELLSWGSEGSGDGEFYGTGMLDVAPNGHIFVADIGNSRIQEFNTTGDFVKKWDVEFMQFNGDVTVNNEGYIFTTCYDSGGMIQKYADTGIKLSEWDIPHGNGSNKLAHDAEGNIYTTTMYTDIGDASISKYDSNGTFLKQWGGHNGDVGTFYYPTGLTRDDSGNLYVVDLGYERIQKFDSDGNFVMQISLSSFHTPMYLKDVAVGGSDNRIFIVDEVNREMYIYDASGNYMDTILINISRSVVAVAANSDYVFVATRDSTAPILKYDTSGNLLDTWTSIAETPQDIAMDKESGSLYVLESNGIVKRFDLSGQLLSSWGDNGMINHPRSIDTNDKGNIYVLGLYRIFRFDRMGNLQKTWELEMGNIDSKFVEPTGIDVDENGVILISDSYNDRIQKAKDTILDMTAVYYLLF